MGSEFMSVYVSGVEPVRGLVGARSADAVARAVGLVPDDPELVRRLVYAEYPRGEECDDAVELIRACAALIAGCSPHAVTLEFYDDPEQAPLLWEFVWSQTAGCDPFELPLSPYGAPAIAYRDPRVAADFLARFETARNKQEIPPRCMAPDEVDTLIATLRRAVEAREGVWVYREY